MAQSQPLTGRDGADRQGARGVQLGPAEPAEENTFRQLRLNQWVKQSVRWMPMHIWDAGADPVNLDELEGRRCYGGLDLASTTDITAFVLIFPPYGDEEVPDRPVVLDTGGQPGVAGGALSCALRPVAPTGLLETTEATSSNTPTSNATSSNSGHASISARSPSTGGAQSR